MMSFVRAKTLIYLLPELCIHILVVGISAGGVNKGAQLYTGSQVIARDSQPQP